MTHLPGFGACGCTAIIGAGIFGRMLGVHAREHLLLTQEPVVVLLGLGVEACIVVGIVALRAGRSGEYRLAQAPHAAGAGRPIPAVVAAVRIRIAIAYQSSTTRLLRRKH